MLLRVSLDLTRLLPHVVVNHEFARLTRSSFGSRRRPHWTRKLTQLVAQIISETLRVCSFAHCLLALHATCVLPHSWRARVGARLLVRELIRKCVHCPRRRTGTPTVFDSGMTTEEVAMVCRPSTFQDAGTRFIESRYRIMHSLQAARLEATRVDIQPGRGKHLP